MVDNIMWKMKEKKKWKLKLIHHIDDGWINNLKLLFT
jgi:hypothetical protein